MTTTSRVLAVILWSLLLVLPVQAEEFAGPVTRVLDGDTIEVLHDSTPERIRLARIDAPEKNQAFGQQAKSFTATQCFGHEVTIVTQGRDRYGRTIGEVLLPDGQDLNQELVDAGYAWWYRKYAPAATDLQELEANARANARGLWVDPYAVAPWEFRHRSRISAK